MNTKTSKFSNPYIFCIFDMKKFYLKKKGEKLPLPLPELGRLWPCYYFNKLAVGDWLFLSALTYHA